MWFWAKVAAQSDPVIPEGVMLKPFPEPLSGSAVIMRDRQFVYQIGRRGLGEGQPSGDDEDMILFLTDTNLQG